MAIYTRLLKANTSPDKDPCWESKEWADALKADCMYRLGLCFEHLGTREVAEHCYLQYMNLLATGIEGAYSVDDVLARIRRLSSNAGAEEREKGYAMRSGRHLRPWGLRPRGMEHPAVFLARRQENSFLGNWRRASVSLFRVIRFTPTRMRKRENNLRSLLTLRVSVTLNRAKHSRQSPPGLAIGKISVAVGPTAGHVDIEHFQRLVRGDEPVGGAGRQPQEIAGFQGVFLAVEHGRTMARQDEVVFLRHAVIADSGPLMSGDGDAVDGRPAFLGQVDQRLDGIRAQALGPSRVATVAVDQSQRRDVLAGRGPA